MESFFKKYTLHDSYWVGIFSHVGFSQSVTIAIEWDFVWLPNEVKKNVFVDSWPYLFIKLEGVSYFAVDDVFGGQVTIVFKGKQSILALNSDGSYFKI